MDEWNSDPAKIRTDVFYLLNADMSATNDEGESVTPTGGRLN